MQQHPLPGVHDTGGHGDSPTGQPSCGQIQVAASAPEEQRKRTAARVDVNFMLVSVQLLLEDPGWLLYEPMQILLDTAVYM